jgi:uncharacterized membrane protein YkvA (DUF1232 family)
MSRRRRRAAYTAAAAAAMSEGPVGFSTRVASVPRMVRDTLSGQYPGLTRSRLLLMAAALLYILAPVDLVPEALLTVPGLLDDAAIGAWLVATLLGATTTYHAWEVTGSPAGPADPDGPADPRDPATRAHGAPGASGVPHAARGDHRVVPGEVVSP